MSFPKLAQRFRDLAYRQPSPSVEAAARELSRLKVQGMRKWFLAKLCPNPAELWSWHQVEHDRQYDLGPTADDDPLPDSTPSTSASEGNPPYNGPIVDREAMEIVLRDGRRVDAFPEIWEIHWEVLVRFLAIKHPSEIPGGHALSSGIEHRSLRSQEVRYETDRSQWRATALDYATCCDLLADLAQESTATRAYRLKSKTYKPTELTDCLGISSGTLNKYAKESHVTTPSRGQSNFTYTENDVRRIAEHVIAHKPRYATEAKALLQEIKSRK
jgi:hypothetical protein